MTTPTHAPLFRYPSASSALRVLQCPGSVVLPRGPYTPSTPAMNRGSYLHLRLEQFLTGHHPRLEPRFDALVRVLDAEDQAMLDMALSTISRDDILRGSELLTAEEAFAYSPATDTARSLGVSIEREYTQHGLDPHTEIAGTADLILRTPSGTLVVGDFKTRHYDSQVSHAWQPQLDMLALSASRAYHVDTVTTAICLVMDSGRVHWTEERTYDVFDLDAIAARVRDAVRQWHTAAAAFASGAVPVTNPGAWCDYCSSRSLCPAWRSLARTFAEDTVALSVAATELDLTPNTAGAAWEKLDRYDALAGELRKQLRDYAHRTPLVLSDGTRLGHVERTREELDGERTRDYLRTAYSVAKADEVCEVKVTKAALERVFGREQSKEILGTLRKSGAVKQNRFTVMGEIRAKGKRAEVEI